MRTTRYFFFWSLFLLTTGQAFAQTDSSAVSAAHDTVPTVRDTASFTKTSTGDSAIRYRINGAYLRSIVEDLAYTASRPFHWGPKDFTRFGVVIGTAGVLMAGDYEIKQLFARNHTNFQDQVAHQIEPFGNAYSPYLIVGMYLAGVVGKQRQLEHASLMTAKSLLISTALYTFTKIVVRRQRPSFGDNPFNYNAPFTNDKQHTAFPSGHMLTVTTVATALSEIYGEDHPWVPWVAYSVAGLTGVSRLYHNRHWSSDVWIGASLGYFVTKTVFKHQRQRSKKGTYNQLAVP